MFGLADRRARAAASWLARMGNTTVPFDRNRFERWRDSHPGNARAFDEAARSWGLNLPVAATRYGRDAGSNAANRIGGVSRAYGSRRLVLAAAAGVLLIGVIGFGLERSQTFGGSEILSSAQLANRVATGAHQTRILRLSDGSIVTLGTDSDLAIDYERYGRHLTLLRGIARFDVAHDSKRAFAVHAGRGLITARGTVFEVRVGPQGVDVILLHGKVEVERVEGKRRTGDIRALAPGQRLTVPVTGQLGIVDAVAPTGTSAVAMLTFDNTPLVQAAGSLNKHNIRQLVIVARPLSEKTVTGAFDANDPEGFARTIAAMFDMSLTQRANGDLLLSEKRS
jgi:transmembrane sensor